MVRFAENAGRHGRLLFLAPGDKDRPHEGENFWSSEHPRDKWYQSVVARCSLVSLVKFCQKLMENPQDSDDYGGVARLERVMCESLDANLWPLVQKCQVMKEDLDEMKKTMGNQMDVVEDKFNDLSLQVASLADRWLESLQELRFEMMFLRRDVAKVSLGDGHPRKGANVSVPKRFVGNRGKKVVHGAESARTETKSAGQSKPKLCFICEGPHLARVCPHREMVRATVDVGKDAGVDFEEESKTAVGHDGAIDGIVQPRGKAIECFICGGPHFMKKCPKVGKQASSWADLCEEG